MLCVLMAAAAFFAEPSPFEMPRASAYMVTPAGGPSRLEDRFESIDIWMSRAITGCWIDADRRTFMLASLDVAPPAIIINDLKSRTRYGEVSEKLDKKDDRRLFQAVDSLSPIDPVEKFLKSDRSFRGLDEVRYYQGTNTKAVVCAFLPEKQDHWQLATWILAADDDYEEQLRSFEKEFLSDANNWREKRVVERGKSAAQLSERELLRADARHSVAAFDRWHVTDGEDYVVLDDLPQSESFVATLTNELTRARGEFAAAIPSVIEFTNSLAVARIFANKREYLDTVGEDMDWTAAYWCQSRRELVAYLPQGGEKELLQTLRHEAFHQYFAYATSMIAASPWFNEGYAEYFENPSNSEWQVEADVETLAPMLPLLFKMGYAEFYGGTDIEKLLKYRLAWSVAYFVENGARKVRFDPFANLKRDYIEALLKTRNMEAATAAAFGSEEKLVEFITEWKKFWRKE